MPTPTPTLMPTRAPNLRRRLFAAALLGILWLLPACSTHYVVDAQFPAPLVPALPVVAHLHLSDEFSGYVFTEQRKGRRKISLSLGAAQVALFRSVTDQLSSADKSAPHLHLHPQIVDLQYAMPRETRAEIYEVWLKYRVQVTADPPEPDAELGPDTEPEPIADWLLTGYGKAPSAFLQSPQAGLNAAATMALRDTGAQLSIGLRRQPPIQTWLRQQELRSRRGAP